MPTVTTFATFLVSNLGPLTTTFTAPASCLTGTNLVEVGPAASPLSTLWAPDCGPLAGAVGQCQPSGATIDAFYSSNFLRASQGLLSYYSPGIVCPASWTTAGVTSRNADDSPGGASGAFSVPTRTETYPLYLQWNTALGQILEPGETAAVCCPRGYTIPPDGDYCYSVLPISEYQPSAGSPFCYLTDHLTDLATLSTTLTINGQPRPTQILEITGPASLTPVSTTLSPARATHGVGVRIVPMVPLVHKEADLSATSSGGAPAGSSNAASPLRPTSAGVWGVWPVVVVAVAMAAGAALMFPL